MLGGEDGGGDGGDDADGGSVSATSGVAQLLLASESLLGLLLLQEILDGIARRTRLLEHFERVLEFRLDSVRDVVAGEVVFRLLADLALLEFLLDTSWSAATNDQTSAENGFGAKSTQSARHRLLFATLDLPARMPGDTLITLLTQRSHVLDKDGGDDRDDQQQLHHLRDDFLSKMDK